MGKGDKKSKKGKRFRHSYGKTRLRKKKVFVTVKKKIEEKPKPVEQKKSLKPETEKEQPAEVVTSVVEEVKIEAPQVTEIKEKVQVPEVRESPVSEIPEIEKKSEVVEKAAVPEKAEKEEVKEVPVSEIPEVEKKPEVVEKEEVEEKDKKEEVKEEKKAPKKKAPKKEVKKDEEKKTPKKRGRPKKKKE